MHEHWQDMVQRVMESMMVDMPHFMKPLRFEDIDELIAPDHRRQQLPEEITAHYDMIRDEWVLSRGEETRYLRVEPMQSRELLNLRPGALVKLWDIAKPREAVNEPRPVSKVPNPRRILSMQMTLDPEFADGKEKHMSWQIDWSDLLQHKDASVLVNEVAKKLFDQIIDAEVEGI